MSSKTYIPSTTEGKTWSVFVHKPQGRPAYASAIEGESKDEGGFHSFSFMMFQARQYTVHLEGNNTAKNRAKALHTLRTQMVDAEVISPDAPAFY